MGTVFRNADNDRLLITDIDYDGEARVLNLERADKVTPYEGSKLFNDNMDIEEKTNYLNEQAGVIVNKQFVHD